MSELHIEQPVIQIIGLGTFVIEQEFLASMVTSIGEAGILAPPPEEMVAIMMVLKNRKEDAQQNGYKNANMLDAALQSLQFSMYNRGAHHWSDALNRSNSDSQTQYAFDAFIKFKNMKCERVKKASINPK